MSYASSVLTLNHEPSQADMQYPIEGSLSVNIQQATGLHILTCGSKAFVTALHASRKYFSRYFGNRVARRDETVGTNSEGFATAGHPAAMAAIID